MDDKEEFILKLSKLDKTLTEPLNFIFDEILKLSSKKDKESEGYYIDFAQLETLIITAITSCIIDIYESGFKIILHAKRKSSLFTEAYKKYKNTGKILNEIIENLKPHIDLMIKEYEAGKIDVSTFAIVNKLKELNPSNSDVFDEHISFFKWKEKNLKRK